MPLVSFEFWCYDKLHKYQNSDAKPNKQAIHYTHGQQAKTFPNHLGQMHYFSAAISFASSKISICFATSA